MKTLKTIVEEGKEKFKEQFVEYHDDYKPYLKTYKDSDLNAAEDSIRFLDTFAANLLSAFEGLVPGYREGDAFSAFSPDREAEGYNEAIEDFKKNIAAFKETI